MSEIHFGTDGWRGVIARDFTFANVALCAQGVASYLRREGTAARGIVVGYDTRFASEDFAATAAEVLAGNGIKVYLSDRAAPTPVVGYNIVCRGAAGAVIITASHNPGQWNGFKYRPEYAGSAAPEVTSALEEEVGLAESQGVSSLPLDEARQRRLVEEIDPALPYLEQLSRLVDLPRLRQHRFRVAVDAMFGAGAGYLPRVLAGGATEVTEINGERNPAFPGMHNPEPIARNLTRLSRLVPEQGAHVGLAMDGDADRLGVVDERGGFVTSLQVYALLAYYMLEVRGERGALVKSITATSMIHRLGERYGVPVFETPVGFKHICPIMLRENALMGGEESGGYAIRGHIPERDGVLCGLLFLDLMRSTEKTPTQLVEHLYSLVGPHYYDRRDVAFPPERRREIEGRLLRGDVSSLGGIPVRDVDEIDGRRFHLDGGAWLAVRFSGTEPLLRIYAEAESEQVVRRLLDAAEEFLGLR